jgi:hypothetical protein
VACTAWMFAGFDILYLPLVSSTVPLYGSHCTELNTGVNYFG